MLSASSQGAHDRCRLYLPAILLNPANRAAKQVEAHNAQQREKVAARRDRTSERNALPGDRRGKRVIRRKDNGMFVPGIWGKADDPSCFYIESAYHLPHPSGFLPFCSSQLSPWTSLPARSGPPIKLCPVFRTAHEGSVLVRFTQWDIWDELERRKGDVEKAREESGEVDFGRRARAAVMAEWRGVVSESV